MIGLKNFVGISQADMGDFMPRRKAPAFTGKQVPFQH
jgi:hypothetical protein